MTEPEAKKRKVKLELPKDPSAIYSNMVMITHNAHEVIFDFIQVMPNDDRARLQKRIVMTPTHSKLFLNALQENVAKVRDESRRNHDPGTPNPGGPTFWHCATRAGR